MPPPRRDSHVVSWRHVAAYDAAIACAVAGLIECGVCGRQTTTEWPVDTSSFPLPPERRFPISTDRGTVPHDTLQGASPRRPLSRGRSECRSVGVGRKVSEWCRSSVGMTRVGGSESMGRSVGECLSSSHPPSCRRWVGVSECRSVGCGPSIDFEASKLSLHPRKVFIGWFVVVGTCPVSSRRSGGEFWVV